MSEIRKVTKKYHLRQMIACFLVSCLLFNTTAVLAVEQGNLTGSSGLMGATWGDQTVLNTANNAILDWSNFDTTVTQSVTFNQYLNGALNSNSAVLNRISSGSVPTQFNGALNANGRVFIVNPAGVLFGAGARINVAQLVASSLNIRNQDFIEGKYDFSGGFGPVINEGKIVADSMAALIGRKVLNTGTITAPGGLVIMAAGDRVLLGQPGSDVIVEVVSVAALDVLGDPLSAGDVINEGTVESAGGKIFLAAGDTFSRAIEGLEGLSVAVESGTGRVGQFGTLNADGVEGDGGSITLTAGDAVVLGSDSVTTANAGTNGDGGDVIVYSPEMALFRPGALVEAKGGTESGNGGFFELSGKKHTEIFGDVDMTASNGEIGNFLIDPYNIWINDFGYNEGGVTGGKWTANFEFEEYVGPLGGTYHDSYLDIDDLAGYLNTANVTVSTEGAGDASNTGWILLDTIGHSGSIDDWGSGRDLAYGGSNKLTLEAQDFVMINSGIDFTGSGSLTLDADTDIFINAPLDIGGDIETYSSDSTTYISSDYVKASGSILFNNNTEFTNWDDQHVIAENGTITANGWLKKINYVVPPGSPCCIYASNGSLYLRALGDIILGDSIGNDYVSAALNHLIGGGVSIISDTGRIYTAGYGDTLNVPVTGRSSYGTHESIGLWNSGVRWPDKGDSFGKGAIVIKSSDNLKLGTNAELTAYGRYDTSGLIDDRAGIDFLDVPYTIGGYPRNPGSAFDAAIYVGSSGGNVDVSSPVKIMSHEPIEGIYIDPWITIITGLCDLEYQPQPQGAMVIGAYDTVTFDGGAATGAFHDSLAGPGDGTSYVGDRLEVCSCITEWLDEAIVFGRLPYASSAAAMSMAWYGNLYSYILRGAGLGNSAITDGRAWVLENLSIPPTPLNEQQFAGFRQLIPEVTGCPAVMAAAAEELGIEDEEIEVVIADAMAAAGDIQPCEACARLVNATAILRDEEGSRMAALAEVLNTVAPADVPFTPELGTLIAAAFEGRASDGTVYATALEYVDAFVEYVRVLDTEMNSPVGDSVAFVTEKHGEGISTNPNANVAAYVASRLEAI